MARNRYTADEVIRKLRDADVLIGQGETVADVIQHLGLCGTSRTIAGARNIVQPPLYGPL